MRIEHTRVGIRKTITQVEKKCNTVDYFDRSEAERILRNAEKGNNIIE